ncbi:SPOR domain-containing protein [Treponema porcinum]|uniref:SPOR domain-containing protein n=1 Tax=Treponema porcinum TaxID=261392 RepID=UPI003F0BA4F1
MEQKRTLWIIAAVGVFLLVVLGAALVLYSPASRASQTIAGYSTERGTSSNEWITLAPSAPVQQKTQDEILSDIQTDTKENESSISDFTAISDSEETDGQERKVGELTVYADNATIYSANTKNEPSAYAQDVPQKIINNTTTIDLTAAPKEPVMAHNVLPKSEPAKEAVQKVRQAPARRIAESTQPSKIIAQAEKTPAPKKQTVQKTAEKPAAVKQAEQTQYWVQVTSLTSRKSADTAREVLDENKITADVFTYTDAKGQLFYRVRVGPYTTKSEAEYWQAKIARIDTFKNTSSYVTSTKTAVN